MNREQAEKLLAALIFEDLDEPSKAELLAYLQTDDELRERLADMRMGVKLAGDAVNAGPAPVLSEDRLKELNRLAEAGKRKPLLLFTRRFWTVAAVLMVGVVFVGLMLPSLNKVRRFQAVDHAKVSRDTLAHNGRSTPALPSVAFEAQSRERLGVAMSDSQVDDQPAGGMVGFAGGRLGDTEGFEGMMGGMGSVRPSARAQSETGSDSFVVNEGGPGSVRGGGIYAADSTRLPATQNGDALSRQTDQGSSLMARFGRESQLREELSKRAENADKKVAADEAQVMGEWRTRNRADEKADLGKNTVYSFSESLVPAKSAVPPAEATPTDSQGVLADQSGTTSYGVAGPTIILRRTPVLGDKPLAGGVFRNRTDLDGDGRGDRGRLADPASIAPPVVQRELLDDRKTPVADPNAGDLPSRSQFAVVPVNPWVMTDRDPLSTFGLDVDTASYALCRRYIRSGFLPPVGAVRMEEFINAFDHAYPQRDGATFAVYAEGTPSPFAPAGRDLTLLKVAVKARTVGRDQRRAAHIVFVVDASASMGQADRLPQVQAAMGLLVDKLSDSDRVSLVTCANEARLHLEAVSAREKDRIRQTIDAIQPSGPTNLLEGLRTGYAMARRAFVAGQINQVVLCSDGVANVGPTEAQDVLAEVTDDRKQGITLTCVGVGFGAYNDAFLEALADHGDGRYVFLDSSEQARTDLVGQLAATLQTVARDARIQVQFNPTTVRRYRLIGYENRDIQDQRFRDDTVDAGEVGSGQCSTALYELELASPSASREAGALGAVFVRYRNAETGRIEETSESLDVSIIRRLTIEENPRFFLAAGVARFAEWLRQSEHAKDTRLAEVQGILDRVSAVLPLDRTVQDVAALAHQAENLPRATETTAQP
jgi:Ca-activated chloride channel homolog